MALNLYRIYIITILFAVSFQTTYAQEAFKINWKKELTYWGAGLGANGVGYLLFQDTPEIDADFVLNLDINNINAFDRPAIYRNSAQADFYSDITGNGSVILPAIIYLLKIKDKDWRHSSIMFLEVAMMNLAVANMTKYGFRRTRPYVYNSVLGPDQRINRSGSASFVSGHTSFAASNSFFAAALFQRAYPDSPLVPYVYISAAAIPIATGVNRVRAGRHFNTDVIAGFLTGAAVSTLVVQLHKRDDLRLRTGLNGVGLVLTF